VLAAAALARGELVQTADIAGPHGVLKLAREHLDVVLAPAETCAFSKRRLVRKERAHDRCRTLSSFHRFFRSVFSSSATESKNDCRAP
jgi:hypothetical protein